MKEIDLIEMEDGVMRTYEFKWNAKRMPTLPSVFATTYPDATFKVITPDNMWEFV